MSTALSSFSLPRHMSLLKNSNASRPEIIQLVTPTIFLHPITEVIPWEKLVQPETSTVILQLHNIDESGHLSRTKQYYLDHALDAIDDLFCEFEIELFENYDIRVAEESFRNSHVPAIPESVNAELVILKTHCVL